MLGQVDAAAITREVVISQLPQLVKKHGRHREHVEHRDASPMVESQKKQQRNHRCPQEAENLSHEDGSAVGGSELPLIEPVECQRRSPRERPLPQPRVQKRQWCEQKPQEDQQRKSEHVEGVADETAEAACFQYVGNVFRIFGRAIDPLAVVVAVVACKKGARCERHNAGQQIPGDLEHGHLVLAEVTDLVDQRAQAIEPEGRHRKRHELRPRAKGQREIGGSRHIGRHQAQQKVSPVTHWRHSKEVDVGSADRLPHLPNPGHGVVG